MLRITETATGTGVRLILEGKLVGAWVAELNAACLRTRADGRPLELDLSGVSYVDAGGERLLRELIADGAAVVNCSGFVRETLRRRNDR